jgi:hypothetical protein
MSELDKLTTTISSSFTDIKVVTMPITLEDLIKNVSLYLNLGVEEIAKLREGVLAEKNKSSQFAKVLLETIVLFLDKNTIDTSDKTQEAIFIQNKKIVKDLLFNNIQLTSHYTIDDSEFKLILLGKLIQSLYDRRKQ